MGFICLPCQIGGKEDTGYGDRPFDGKDVKYAVIRNNLYVQNDYKNAYKEAGKEEFGGKSFIPFKDVSSGNVHEWYDGAVPLERFIESEQSEGDLLLMSFQLKSNTKKLEGNPKRFYVARFPFKGFNQNRFEVAGVTGVCGGLTWGGIKPCEVTVNFSASTVTFDSSALTMANVPMSAIYVLPKEQLKF